MCYCAKIKEMMQESKESEKPVISTLDGGTIFVNYCEQYDEFTFQYSWIIDEDKETVIKEVKQGLENYSFDTTHEIELVQLGLVTVYHTNMDYFCRAIERGKNKELEPERDTKYVFMGHKVLRVVQYYGMYSNPFDCLETTFAWNQPEKGMLIKKGVVYKTLKGLEYYHVKDKNSIIFSFGSDSNKLFFEEKVLDKVPVLFLIDDVNGNVVHGINK